MLLILMVCVGNVVLGFALAVHLGHGPAGVELPKLERVRNLLRRVLRVGGTHS